MTLPTMTPIFLFFYDTATTEIYTLSLHDALPISTSCCSTCHRAPATWPSRSRSCCRRPDRKSTRLNSSHPSIAYAVVGVKKKNGSRSFCDLHQTFGAGDERGNWVGRH